MNDPDGDIARHFADLTAIFEDAAAQSAGGQVPELAREDTARLLSL